MKVLLLALLLALVRAEEPVLLCTYGNFDLCLGISAGDGVPQPDKMVQLKSRIENLYQNRSARSVSLARVNQTVALAFYPNLTISKQFGSTLAIWDTVPGSNFTFDRVNLTVRLDNGNNRCLTVMTCSSNEDWCDKNSWRPVRSPKQIKNGAYVRYRNCTSDLDVAQLFIENPQCAEGCTDEMLMNDVCDPDCNVKSCKWDLRRCPRKTQQPTEAPTESPKTETSSPHPTETPSTTPQSSSPTDASQTPTLPIESLPPTPQPTFSPTQSPSSAPSTAPTAQPSSSPSISPSTTPSEAPVALPTEAPTLVPTHGDTSFPPSAANNTTRQPTKEYEIYEKISESPSIEETSNSPTVQEQTKVPTKSNTESPTSQPTDNPDMSSLEDYIITTYRVAIACLVIVLLIFTIVAVWHSNYVKTVKNLTDSLAQINAGIEHPKPPAESRNRPSLNPVPPRSEAWTTP